MKQTGYKLIQNYYYRGDSSGSARALVIMRVSQVSVLNNEHIVKYSPLSHKFFLHAVCEFVDLENLKK